MIKQYYEHCTVEVGSRLARQEVSKLPWLWKPRGRDDIPLQDQG